MYVLEETKNVLQSPSFIFLCEVRVKSHASAIWLQGHQVLGAMDVQPIVYLRGINVKLPIVLLSQTLTLMNCLCFSIHMFLLSYSYLLRVFSFVIMFFVPLFRTCPYYTYACSQGSSLPANTDYPLTKHMVSYS